TDPGRSPSATKMITLWGLLSAAEGLAASVRLATCWAWAATWARAAFAAGMWSPACRESAAAGLCGDLGSRAGGIEWRGATATMVWWAGEEIDTTVVLSMWRRSQSSTWGRRAVRGRSLRWPRARRARRCLEGFMEQSSLKR